jgi:hypothetical protein
MPPEGMIERRREAITWSIMDEHLDKKLEPIHQKLDELLLTIKSSVPDGDLEGHRKAHEEWLEERKQRKKMWYDVRKDMVTWALRGIIVAILVAAWFWIQSHIVQIPPPPAVPTQPLK